LVTEENGTYKKDFTFSLTLHVPKTRKVVFAAESEAHHEEWISAITTLLQATNALIERSNALEVSQAAVTNEDKGDANVIPQVMPYPMSTSSHSDFFDSEMKGFGATDYRGPMVDTMEGFHGEYRLQKSDKLEDLWQFLGVPFPVRLALAASEAQDEKLKITVAHDTTELENTTSLYTESTGALIPHSWHDVLTFRGTVTQKQMYWDETEDERLSLMCITRLETSLGQISEEFQLSGDGSILLQRVVVSNKRQTRLLFKRSYTRISESLKKK